MLCTLIFICIQTENQRSTQTILRNQQSSYYNSLIFSVKSVKGQILAIISTVTRSMQCNNKKFSVKILTADEDQSTQHKLASATLLISLWVRHSKKPKRFSPFKNFQYMS